MHPTLFRGCCYILLTHDVPRVTEAAVTIFFLVSVMFGFEYEFLNNVDLVLDMYRIITPPIIISKISKVI